MLATNEIETDSDSAESAESAEWPLEDDLPDFSHWAPYSSSWNSPMDEESRTLASVGHDPDLFLQEVDDDFKCAICRNVVERPIECARCESLFCDPHLQEWLKTRARCPKCNQGLNASYLRRPSRIIRNTLGKLRMRCHHHVRGCEAEVALADMEEHLRTECDFVQVHCPFEDCPKHEANGATLDRRDLEVHLETCTYRMVECELGCGTEMPFWFLQEHLDTECPNNEVICELGCGAKFLRSDMARHESECPCETIECPMYGCAAQVARKDLEEHLQASYLKHLTCVSQAVVRQQQVISSLTEQVADLEKHKYCSVLQTPCSVVFPVTQVRERIEAARVRKVKIRSPRYMLDNGLCFELEVGLDATYLSVYLSLQPGAYDGLLKWPFNHNYSLVVLDQTDREPQHIERTVNTDRHPDSQVFRHKTAETQRGHGFAKFSIITKLQTRRYLANNVLYVKALFHDLPLMR